MYCSCVCISVIPGALAAAVHQLYRQLPAAQHDCFLQPRRSAQPQSASAALPGSPVRAHSMSGMLLPAHTIHKGAAVQAAFLRMAQVSMESCL